MTTRLQSVLRSRITAAVAGAVLASLGWGWVLIQFKEAAEDRIKWIEDQGDRVPVVFAARELRLGVPIGVEDVMLRELPRVAVSEDATFDAPEDVVGRIPRSNVLEGEILRGERLSRADAGAGLEAVLSPGSRAFTLDLSTEQAVSGSLQAGSRVDIVVTDRRPDASGLLHDLATWRLDAIRVLAVGGCVTQDPDRSRDVERVVALLTPCHVTFELLPEQVDRLAAALPRGDIRLALRSDLELAP